MRLMTQFTFDTDKHLKWIAFGIIAILIFGMAINYSYYAGKDAGAATVTIITPAPTPEPTSAIPTYPSVLTYTVLSTTTASGHYQVITTAGQILYFNNYYDWNTQEPQNAYTATVTGTSGSAYLISDPVLIAQHYYAGYYRDQLRFYEYGGKYYQSDGHQTDEVSWKEARGQYVYHGRPPT